MTGLDAEKDVILQIACFVTDYDLNLLDEAGFETTIHQSKNVLDNMDKWCTETHTGSGLVSAVLASEVTPEQASANLLQYIKKYVPDVRRALLAGSSVHADKLFLLKPPYNEVLEHLHYRILDVSAIKEAARRWASEKTLAKTPRRMGLHKAKEDIIDSIAEARYYRDTFFK